MFVFSSRMLTLVVKLFEGGSKIDWQCKQTTLWTCSLNLRFYFLAECLASLTMRKLN